MKKVFIVALIISIALMATLVPARAVYAEDNIITARVLNNNEDTLYHIFNSPKNIFYTNDGLYITTADGCEIYADKSITASDITADDFAFLNGLITLNNGTIYYNTKPLEGTYSEISAFGSTLYALSDNTIYSFELTDNGTFAEGKIYPTLPLPITNIAATESGCAYTVLDTDGSTKVILDGKQFGTPFSEEILDIEYNGTLYVLTTNKVLFYLNSYSYTTYNIVDAKSFTLGDKVYILTRTGNVESLTLDFAPSAHSTIIAASSDADWFYSAPVGGSTRLGKIYIADRYLGRIAIIDDKNISYLSGLNQPVAVVADNMGTVYVAHYGNRIAKFVGGQQVQEYFIDENIIDLQVDYDNKLFALTEDGQVLAVNHDNSYGDIKVKAFDFQNGWHFMTEGYIDDKAIDATDFCTDIVGSIFAVNGNTITAIIDNQTTTYTVANAAHISAVIMSKVDNSAASYGDLILLDDINKCVLIVDGSEVGSANVKDMYTPPALTNTPNNREEGIVGTSIGQTYMFALPIEGEISYVLDDGDDVIICKDVLAPDPFIYCIYDDPNTKTLKSGFMYKSVVQELPYHAPKYAEAKVNADNTPVYKYPTIHSPIITHYAKGNLVSILPFAVNSNDEYGDGWYTDIYGNKWYRIAYGDNEGYILVADANTEFFSNAKMPKTNATITENAILYRYDSSTGEYVEFEAAGLYITKDTRVMVELPFDTSRKYTKIVFYRDGYGTIDADCYVKTEYIKFDGVDIVKIIAFSVIAVALVTLVLVIIHKRKLNKKYDRKQNER